MIRLGFRTIVFLFAWFHIQCTGIFQQEKDNSRDNLLLLGLIALQNRGANCNTEEGIWARNIQTNRSDCIPARLVAEGIHGRFFLEVGLNPDLNFNQLSLDFDNQIHPALVDAFGEPSDINQDGKVDIFVLDVRDGSTPGNPFVAGFFDPVDFFQDNPNSTIRSNQRELLYLDGKELVNILGEDPLAFGSTLAHEYQHLIRFPRMLQTGFQDNTWINEGTSEVASDLGGFGPQTHRIRCLRGSGDSPCVGGGNNVSLLAWNSGPANDPNYILKQYSYSYAFMRFLYDNSGNDITSRNEFFRNTVNGNSNGLRARQILNLMTLFREATNNTSANSYPTNPLGSDNRESFLILLNRFWAQVIMGSDTTNVARSNNSSINLGSPNDDFSFNNSTALSSLPTSSYPLLTNLPGAVPSGAAVFVAGDRAATVSGTTGTDFITSIPNNSNSIVVFAETNPNASLTTPQANQKMDWNEWVKNYSEITKDQSSGLGGKAKSGTGGIHNHSGAIPLCGNPFLPDISEKK